MLLKKERSGSRDTGNKDGQPGICDFRGRDREPRKMRQVLAGWMDNMITWEGGVE